MLRRFTCAVFVALIILQVNSVNAQSLALQRESFGVSASNDVQQNLPKPTVILVQGFKTTTVLFGGTGSFCTPQAQVWKPGLESDFGALPNWLTQDGYQDIRIAYLTTNHDETPSLEINAVCLQAQVVDALSTSASGKIVLIGHSMGGLVVRAYVDSPLYVADAKMRGDDFIKSVFTIGSPNQGVPLHFFLNLLLNCEAPNTRQRAACEFSNFEWMQSFNERHPHRGSSIPLYLVGGTRHNLPAGMFIGLWVGSIAGAHDGTIPVASATNVEGKHQAIRVDEGHLPIVGFPAYFHVADSAQRTQTYTYCLRPVLVENNPDGCMMPASNDLWWRAIVWYGFLAGVILYAGISWFLVLKKLREPIRNLRRIITFALVAGFLLGLYLVAAWANLFWGLVAGFAITFAVAATLVWRELPTRS